MTETGRIALVVYPGLALLDLGRPCPMDPLVDGWIGGALADRSDLGARLPGTG